jgi:excisionase family DNA binding protein
MASPGRDELDMPLMDVREVACLLGYGSEWPVRRLIKSGELRAYKIRGRLKVSQTAVDELLAGAQVEPARPSAAPVPPRSPATSAPTGGAEVADTAAWLLERRKARRERAS